MKFLTKKAVENSFKSEILPAIKERYESNGIKDFPARSEAWNFYTDSLCKNGEISINQYNNWGLPKFCEKSNK